MLSIFVFLPILGTALALESASTHSLGLDPNVPIYLGDIFYPPTMNFMAWLPSDEAPTAGEDPNAQKHPLDPSPRVRRS